MTYHYEAQASMYTQDSTGEERLQCDAPGCDRPVIYVVQIVVRDRPNARVISYWCVRHRVEMITPDHD
jgi:hypothetical protein